jgi:hypothetical protein
MGTNDIKIDSRTEGSRPVMTPMMTDGTSFSQVRKLMVLRYSTLLTIPTKPTGMAQKRIRAEMKASTA